MYSMYNMGSNMGPGPRAGHSYWLDRTAILALTPRSTFWDPLIPANLFLPCELGPLGESGQNRVAAHFAKKERFDGVFDSQSQSV